MKPTIRYFFIILFVFSINLLFAREVTISQARQLAKNVYFEKANQYFTIDYTDIKFSEEFTISQNSKALYYIFNVKNDKGFVIVAGDDYVHPVIGYSFSGKYKSSNQSPSFINWMDNYKNQIIFIQENKVPNTTEIQEAWQKYSASTKTKFISPMSSVAPLTTSIWSQGCLFNDSCPVDSSGPCNHVVTGCVATALAQVINYYNYPQNGSGSHTYLSNYGTLTANFGNTTYNWANMADTLNSSSTAAQVASVAQLISQCGIGVEMSYSPGGSGAYSINALNAIVHHFNFSKDIEMVSRINYPDSVWNQILRNELNQNRVMYYDGSGSGGHAFVCDGYQNDDYFHFNWGWNGSHNGYFYVTNLNPAGMNFSNYQSAIIGIEPDSISPCTGSDTLTTPYGNINDGSIGFNYNNNSDCRYLIQPTGGVSISLDFYTFDLHNSDTVYVYDGSTTSATLLGSFTGTSLPPTQISSGGNMLVRFVSDNTNNSQGWSASYKTNYCAGTKMLANPTAIINDGSGNYNYNDLSDCKWLIQPAGANYVTLIFNSFHTEAGFDYVKVYDGSTTSSTLLGNFDGTNLPPTLTSSSGSMLIHFTSDGGVTDDGWSATYTACFPKPVIDTGQSTTICQGDTFVLSVPNNFSNYQWLNNGVIIPNATDSFYSPSQSGNYSVIVASTFCPVDTSKEAIVNINPKPFVHIGTDTVVCVNHTLVLDAGSGFSSYLWSDNSFSQTLIIDSTGVGVGVGTYFVIVSDSNGCFSSDSINIAFDPCTGFENPIENQNIKIFPNPSKGKFEVFTSDNSLIKNISARVYNIQGQKIFEENYKEQSKFTIDISNHSQGIYFLHLNNEFWQKKIKIILQ